MKFDYSKQFAMMDNIPNLAPTFQSLRPVTTTLKKRGDIFGFFFFSICGTMFILGCLNIPHKIFPTDYSVGYKVLPDYITGTNFVAYRKERKHFILY